MDPAVNSGLQSSSSNTADWSDLSFSHLSTVSPELPSLVSASSVRPTANLSALRRPPGSSVDVHRASAAPALSAADGDSALRGVLVAVQALVLLSIFLLSSLGNSAVVVVIVKHRRLRTVTNAFVASLSLSDFLAAVLCLPFSFVMLFGKDGAWWTFGDAFCVANGFFNTCFGIVSTLTMTLISFDRYYAIVRQPRAKIDRRQAARLLTGVWLTAAAFSLPWYLLVQAPANAHKRSFHRCTYVFHPGTSSTGAAYSVSLIVVCFLLPFSLMCFCHYNICKTVRLSETRVRPVTTYAHLPRFYGEMRTATTVLVMIVFVVFCRGPYCLMGLVAAIGDYGFDPAADAAATWLAWANGAVNPLIYALRNPNISVLLGRSREEGYRTRNVAAYLSGQNREARRKPAEAIRDRYVSRAGANDSRLSSSSPGKAGGGGEVAMWACRNPAVFFCRDAQPDTAAPPGAAGAVKTKTADTSL
ncbi:G-protein coupled receptor 135 [Cololabis saira]|uniref:G-protein coupled receptor 135 n=1 Tax=Cololabis saira TaxID=129043 RepID=UPI002AD44F48|nr:G-protein coupled receptor 135 [Cololabis saira]